MKKMLLFSLIIVVTAGIGNLVWACGPFKCGMKNKKVKQTAVDQKSDSQQAQSKKAEGTLLLVSVGGMTCEACEENIETSLYEQEGISFVKASQDKGSITIYYDDQKISKVTIVKEIEKLPYKLISVSI